MNILAIVNIVPSSGPGVLSYLEVALDYTAMFHGKEWISSAGVRTPYYQAQPADTTVLPATTLQLVDNDRFTGTYTVYTPTSNSDPNVSVALVGGNTRIFLRDTLPAGTGAELTTGSVNNVSTYLLPITGEASKLVLERQLYTDRPINLFGRDAIMWGEGMQDNLIMSIQNFAGPSAPLNPFQGQTWYNTTSGSLMIWSGSPSNIWSVANSASAGTSFRYTQSVTSTTWIIVHNMNLAAPFICMHSFFVNTVGGVKPVQPADVTYDNSNQFTVTFNSAESGYALLRS
jgi:hypothetical protein